MEGYEGSYRPKCSKLSCLRSAKRIETLNVRTEPNICLTIGPSILPFAIELQMLSTMQ